MAETTIQMGQTYRAITAMLKNAGFNGAWCLDVEWWRHTSADRVPDDPDNRPKVKLFVCWPDDPLSYTADSADALLVALSDALAARRERSLDGLAVNVDASE